MVKSKLFLVAALCVLSLTTNPSRASFCPTIVAASVAAPLLGLGAMFTVFAIRDDAAYYAQYNTSNLIATNYSAAQKQCVRCFNNAPSSCSHSPFTATTYFQYQAYFNDSYITEYTSRETNCGASSAEAISHAQQTFPLGSSTLIWYQIDWPASWTPNLRSSSTYIVGQIFMFLFGGAAAVATVLLLTCEVGARCRTKAAS